MSKGRQNRSVKAAQAWPQEVALSGLLRSRRCAHWFLGFPGRLSLGVFFGGAFAADRQQHFALTFHPLLRLLALGGGGGRLALVSKTAFERVHQVDDIAGALRRGFGWSLNAAA